MVNKDRLHRRFGEVLREKRKERGLTQEVLAQKAGITPVYVSQLERGLKSPSLWTIARLSKVLGVSMRKIVGAVEDK